jgi:hypothetical protein
MAGHHDQGCHGAVPAGHGDPAQQVVGQERYATLARRPGASGRALRLLELEGDRGRGVDEQLEPQDLERQEWLPKP